jgi:hypothetical protein
MNKLEGWFDAETAVHGGPKLVLEEVALADNMPQQDNSSDCGVFSLMAAKNIIYGLDPTECSLDNILEFRVHVTDMLLNSDKQFVSDLPPLRKAKQQAASGSRDLKSTAPDFVVGGARAPAAPSAPTSGASKSYAAASGAAATTRASASPSAPTSGASKSSAAAIAGFRAGTRAAERAALAPKAVELNSPTAAAAACGLGSSLSRRPLVEFALVRYRHTNVSL